MPRIWKETLCLGTQRDRFGNVFTFDRRDIRQAHRNCRRMLSRGVPLPCVWEHQDVEAGDSAARRAAYAKYTFGHIVGQRINGRGNLELLHEVPDPNDAAQLVKTRFVSPKVYSGYSDSRGGDYQGTVIVHVASTPTPVQTWQSPFRLLSQGRTVFLSYAGGPSVPDKTNDDGGESSAGGAGAGTGEFTKLLDALREYGMSIPDEVTDQAGLIIAIKSNNGGSGDDDDGLDLDDADPDAGVGSTGSASAPPMLMSDARAEPLRKVHRRDMGHRINRLFSTGRVDRPTAQRMLGKAKSVQLSFTRDGEPFNNRLLAEIEAYEKLPKGLAWSRSGGRQADARELSATTGVGEPEQLATGVGESDLDAVVKEQERLAAQMSSGSKKA